MMHSQAWNFSELSSYGHFEHDWSDDTLSTLCDNDDDVVVNDCPLYSADCESSSRCALFSSLTLQD
eukprot:scaffold12999_cov64-Skeletonema_dohrnii-CCMP3373.AAC.1